MTKTVLINNTNHNGSFENTPTSQLADILLIERSKQLLFKRVAVVAGLACQQTGLWRRGVGEVVPRWICTHIHMHTNNQASDKHCTLTIVDRVDVIERASDALASGVVRVENISSDANGNVVIRALHNTTIDDTRSTFKKEQQYRAAVDDNDAAVLDRGCCCACNDNTHANEQRSKRQTI